MRILIAGGAGYIGGVTSQLVHKAGHQLTVIDNLSTGHASNLPPETTFHQGDIRDHDFVAKVFAENQYDIVMNFAAKILVSESMMQPYNYYQNNVVGSLELIDQAAQHNVKGFILSSTAAVYGEPDHMPLRETDPTHPVNPYGASKLMVEHLLQSYEITHHLPWCALRYFNVAGAYHEVGPAYPFVSHIVPMLLDKLRRGEPVTIFGKDFATSDGTAIRDYVHVVDIAQAHLAAAEAFAAGKTLNQPINLSSGTGFSVKQVIDTFLATTHKDIAVTYGDRRPGDPAQLFASNDRAKKVLGWQPKHDLASIIRDHYVWSVAHEATP